MRKLRHKEIKLLVQNCIEQQLRFKLRQLDIRIAPLTSPLTGLPPSGYSWSRGQAEQGGWEAGLEASTVTPSSHEWGWD